jgi:hypothetical protein
LEFSPAISPNHSFRTSDYSIGKIQKAEGFDFQADFCSSRFLGRDFHVERLASLYAGSPPDDGLFGLVVAAAFNLYSGPLYSVGDFRSRKLSKPEIVIALLAVFSVYDIVAVYKTKHMVEMAKEMIDSRAILGLIIPRNLSGFGEGLIRLKPGGKFLILGGGDIVFPLFLCCSLIPSYGIAKSFLAAAFSILGLLASFFLFAFQKKRSPIPALPPIAFFSIVGYLVVRFLV